MTTVRYTVTLLIHQPVSIYLLDSTLTSCDRIMLRIVSPPHKSWRTELNTHVQNNPPPRIYVKI